MRCFFEFLLVIFLSSCSIFHLSTSNKSCEFYFDKKLKARVYIRANVFPEYEKGELHLLNLLANEISYPSNNSVQGRIIIAIIIDEKGRVIDCEIPDKKKENITTFESQVLKLFKERTLWKPAICKDKKVKFKLYRPIEILIRE